MRSQFNKLLELYRKWLENDSETQVIFRRQGSIAALKVLLKSFEDIWEMYKSLVEEKTDE